jgi:lysophospholipase L1-like esterase
VDYFHRYNPPNYELLDAQCAQLERALADCKRDGIRVVLVDMPLPRRHQTLIDAKLHASYRTKIAAIAAAHGATLLDLNHPDNYNADDWIDSLHVTASGADKFLPELVSSLPE